MKAKLTFHGKNNWIASYDEPLIQMSGNSEIDAINNLNEVCQTLFDSLKKIPLTRLGKKPLMQLDWLRRHRKVWSK